MKAFTYLLIFNFITFSIASCSSDEGNESIFSESDLADCNVTEIDGQIQTKRIILIEDVAEGYGERGYLKLYLQIKYSNRFSLEFRSETNVLPLTEIYEINGTVGNLSILVEVEFADGAEPIRISDNPLGNYTTPFINEDAQSGADIWLQSMDEKLSNKLLNSPIKRISFGGYDFLLKEEIALEIAKQMTCVSR